MTKSGLSRVQRRLSKKSVNKSLSQSPSQPARSQQEKVLENLDHNNKIFRDTLIVLDMSVQSIAAALDDFVCGRPVSKVTIDGEEHVDYNHYLDRFKHILEEMKANTTAAASDTIPVSAALVEPTDEEVHIFGGTGG